MARAVLEVRDFVKQQAVQKSIEVIEQDTVVIIGVTQLRSYPIMPNHHHFHSQQVIFMSLEQKLLLVLQNLTSYPLFELEAITKLVLVWVHSLQEQVMPSTTSSKLQ